ncbi:MAG: hypothetical protein GX754_05240 [Clostridiaceae bacterium]|nr:hypothetical protein [Clostridiaceae bacterium]
MEILVMATITTEDISEKLKYSMSIGNIIIGVRFAEIFIFALRKVYGDMKDRKCRCGSACSDKSKCCKNNYNILLKDKIS